MPRVARLDTPGLLQHVIVRGVERREIFSDDRDRGRFVVRLSGLLEETETQCYAWALIPNHFHLLLMPVRFQLAVLMRRLLTGYAVTFNLFHGRVGHLFQKENKNLRLFLNALSNWHKLFPKGYPFREGTRRRVASCLPGLRHRQRRFPSGSSYPSHSGDKLWDQSR